MSKYAYAEFETPLGTGAVAWGGAGLRAAAFPSEDAREREARIEARAPGAVETDPPPAIRKLINDIAALFAGEPRDLSDADLDMTGIAEFDRNVLALTLDIKPGETKTYGDIARALGDVAFSQRVGQALGRNPFPIIVPCHRVVGADGRMTGFSAPGGTEAKRKLLKIEGALAPELFDGL